MEVSDTIDRHFRTTPLQAKALRKLGLFTILDILYHFPVRYDTAGASGNVSSLTAGTKVTLIGTLSGLKAKKLWKSRRPATEGWFEDGSGKVKVLWFNQPYIAKMAPQNVLVQLTGTVAGKGPYYITNPEIAPAEGAEISAGLFAPEGGAEQNSMPSVFPVYRESSGITSRWFYHALKRIFKENIHTTLRDPIPEDIRARYHLPELSASFVYIHAPEKKEHAEAARKRFAFEEIFALQVLRAQERARNDSEVGFEIKNVDAYTKEFLASLTYAPTGAQARAINAIAADIEKKHPMARLLEGDVGSGKTLVAAATAYAIVKSRPKGQTFGTLQVGYMAPTEILAEQHFQSFIEYFSHLPINIGLITGSGCKKFPSKSFKGQATKISRPQLLKWVESGEIAMLVGTHALIQKSVKFKHLACVIVDEQHRFGTKQRKALAHKGDLPAGRQVQAPHFLSMTATPIPRTLALTMYGDLDISVLDELPPGRAKITTEIVKKEERDDAYKKMLEELQKGRQAFVICPRIEEPDPDNMNAMQAKSAKAEAKRLQKDIFPQFRVGLVHGALTPQEKDSVMAKFVSHEIDILVATSVVEVGVNVPNATVILIEGAERFGLAQLHQLRGRVMRSSHPPYCFLAPEKTTATSLKRLRALEKSSDGFALAETDLETRGAGDLFGISQSGISDLGMEALKNVKLIQAAREEAQKIITDDATLSKHPALRARIAQSGKEMHGE